MSRRARRTALVELNLTPLIDMIFILIIFFMVTGTFVRESGIEVQKPQAATASAQAPTVVLGIDSDNVLWMEGRPVDLRSLQALMARFQAENPDGAVLVAADAASRNGVLVRVLDACRAAGVKNVSIAATRP